jgi:hypothetical protein
VEIRIMTDQGNPQMEKALQIKGQVLSIYFKTKTRIALQMTDGLKPVM